VGDLTALYDLQALWALRHAHDQVRVVVINNGGGRIFERMFASPRFQNRHSLSLEPVAALWGMAYASQLPLAGERGPVLIEVRPSHEQTAAFLEALRAGAAR
jgi:2-succinyl-5-enolpyruvyl-6-hydroxy-3-cyclohexene-1-carboxylate synthase